MDNWKKPLGNITFLSNKPQEKELVIDIVIKENSIANKP